MTPHEPADDAALRRALRADADRAQATDVDAVWDRIRTRAHQRRRRRQVAATSAAALAVVVITAGSQLLPGLVAGPDDRGGERGRPAVTAPAGPTTTPPSATARPPLSERSVPLTPDDARAAFRDAGYDRDDAWQLAEIWRWGDVQAVEVVAGARLARGAGLPLDPGQAAGEAGEDTGWPLYENLLAYASAGYDDTDADALAQEWGADPALLRMLVGELARAGELPADTG